MEKCLVEDCDKDQRAEKLCLYHYYLIYYYDYKLKLKKY